MKTLSATRRLGRGTALAAILLLGGCATVYEGGYARADGWRRGGVVAVQPGTTLERPDYWTCTRDLTREQRSSREYVVVWFVEGRYKGYYAAEVPAGTQLAQRAPVFVNVHRCQDAVVARNERGSPRP